MIKHTKFQRKVILSNLIITMLIMFCVFGIFYTDTVKRLNSRTLQDFEAITSKTISQYDNVLYNMDKTALQIAANPSIVEFFIGIDKNPTTNYFIQNPLKASEVVKILNSYNFKKDAYTRICLYNDYNDFVYSTRAMTTETAVINFFSSKDFNMTKSHFKKNDVYSLYKGPTQDILNNSTLPSPHYFSMVREIKDYSSNSLQCGYVEIQHSVSMLDKLFADLGVDCYAIVFDENGNPIYQTNSLDHQLFDSIDFTNIPMGVTRIGINYLAFYELNEVPLKVLFIKEQSAMLDPLKQYKTTLILATIALLIIATFTNTLIIKRLSRPLVELHKSINNINIDNLHLEIQPSEKSDELQQLHLAFNTMLAHLKQAIDKQIISQTNELKSHLFALQSQMNPHFMHNILAIISLEAQNTGNIKTTKICSKLCKMLKFTSSMGNGFCTLSQEIENAHNYMSLMQERYEELFEYTIELDDSANNISVPKLIIQPICENCFQHAFKYIEPVWKIHIKAYTLEDKWYVEIQDNGNGFSPEYLKAFDSFNQQVTLSNVNEKLQNTSIGGLCFQNIFMRLKLCYLEDFICEIQNTPQGALVKLGGKIND